jgi:fumarate hydratase subunit beta
MIIDTYGFKWSNNLKIIRTPLTSETLQNLITGDQILISGNILTGRDAALPRLIKLIKKDKSPVDLEGAVIMHTAVSPAGIAPTSSNKTEIENSIAPLSEAGVKMHIGKGVLTCETIESLKKNKSVFVVTPPAAALLTSKMKSLEVVAFPEEGMEALHSIEVKDFPAIVAIAHGKSIY